MTSPDIKLFGVTIHKSISRVTESEKIATIIIDVGKLLTSEEIKVHLDGILGQYFSVDVQFDRYSSTSDSKSADKGKGKDKMKKAGGGGVSGGGDDDENHQRNMQDRPVFVFLDFENHEAAWVAYYRLSHAYSTSQILKPHWAQTMQYLTIVEKDKEIMLKNKFFAGF